MITHIESNELSEGFAPSGKVEVRDKKLVADVSGAAYTNRLFVRLVAKGVRFSRVDFRYTTFDACYLRNCVFDECNFIGCRFLSSNFSGSGFAGCRFDYATFEKTDIDDDVLSSGCPSTENMKLRFARSLRINYQQLGNSEAVNKAIGVEIDATEIHLFKSWRSNESYYRKKYAGGRRAWQFFRWLNFWVLEFLWGQWRERLEARACRAVCADRNRGSGRPIFRRSKIR